VGDGTASPGGQLPDTTMASPKANYVLTLW